MKNAWNSECDYEYFTEKWDSYLPILCAWRVDFDWGSFLNVSRMQWNNSFALKRPATMKTVSTFL